MTPFAFAKEIEKKLSSKYLNKIKSFSISSSIKGTKIHCLFETTINSKLYSSPISFELKIPTYISLNQYRDIIIKNLIDAYKDFETYITAKPDVNASYLGEKYSQEIDRLVGVDVMF